MEMPGRRVVFLNTTKAGCEQRREVEKMEREGRLDSEIGKEKRQIKLATPGWGWRWIDEESRCRKIQEFTRHPPFYRLRLQHTPLWRSAFRGVS